MAGSRITRPGLLMGIAPGAACSLFILYDIQSEHYIQSRVATYQISNHESRPYKIAHSISSPKEFFLAEPYFCKKVRRAGIA